MMIKKKKYAEYLIVKHELVENESQFITYLKNAGFTEKPTYLLLYSKEDFIEYWINKYKKKKYDAIFEELNTSDSYHIPDNVDNNKVKWDFFIKKFLYEHLGNTLYRSGTSDTKLQKIWWDKYTAEINLINILYKEEISTKEKLIQYVNNKYMNYYQ